MSGMVSETSLKEQATARAAEERHMEILNLASNKLDCELQNHMKLCANIVSRRGLARSRHVPFGAPLESAALCVPHIV